VDTIVLKAVIRILVTAVDLAMRNKDTRCKLSTVNPAVATPMPSSTSAEILTRVSTGSKAILTNYDGFKMYPFETLILTPRAQRTGTWMP